MSNSWDLMEKWPNFLHIYTYIHTIYILFKSDYYYKNEHKFCIICSLEILKRYWFRKENFTINITESGKSHSCYGNSHPFLSPPFLGSRETSFSALLIDHLHFRHFSFFTIYWFFSIDMLQLNMLPFCIRLSRERNGARGKENNA